MGACTKKAVSQKLTAIKKKWRNTREDYWSSGLSPMYSMCYVWKDIQICKK